MYSNMGKNKRLKAKVVCGVITIIWIWINNLCLKYVCKSIPLCKYVDLSYLKLDNFKEIKHENFDIRLGL